MSRERFLCGVLALLLFVFAAPVLSSQSALAQPANGQQLVILDTDIGDDIDDAFALGLLLHSPD
ncbi:MAG: hypothetical protein WCC31_05255, partial [Terracidiphilus sp.]